MSNQSRRTIDASDVVHQIYVKVVDSTIDPDAKSKKLTLELLKFVHQNLAAFKQMGVIMKVNKVGSADLRNPRLTDAMKRRGITNLPAVLTPNNIYIGLGAIIDMYMRNLQEHKAIAGRGMAAPQGAVMEDEDLFRQFYGNEMTLEKAENDADDASIGDDEKDMMSSYREFMSKREQFAASRQPPRAPQPRAPSQAPRALPPQAQRAAPRPSQTSAPRQPATRVENVPPPRATDPDDKEFLDMIAELSRDIDDNTRQQAFASTTGDSNDDEGTTDPRDDIIMNSWLSNQVPSDS